jgi:hypothetical protein
MKDHKMSPSTDGRTDGRTDRQTDRQTDRRKEVAAVLKITLRKHLKQDDGCLMRV